METKWADSALSRNLALFAKYFPKARKIQLVGDIARKKTYPDKTEIRSVSNWLANFSFA